MPAYGWSLSQYFQLVLFLYEFLVWQLEIPPLCQHSKSVALGIATHNAYILSGWINSFPHLFAACFIHRSKVWRVIYVLFLSIFLVMQTLYWWVPYFFDCCSVWHRQGEEGFKKYELLFGTSWRVLPNLGTHIVPDLEHTILTPLTLVTWILTLKNVLLGDYSKTKVE